MQTPANPLYNVKSCACCKWFHITGTLPLPLETLESCSLSPAHWHRQQRCGWPSCSLECKVQRFGHALHCHCVRNVIISERNWKDLTDFYGNQLKNEIDGGYVRGVELIALA
jgi:hypothetical protein